MNCEYHASELAHVLTSICHWDALPERVLQRLHTVLAPCDSPVTAEIVCKSLLDHLDTQLELRCVKCSTSVEDGKACRVAGAALVATAGCAALLGGMRSAAVTTATHAADPSWEGLDQSVVHTSEPAKASNACDTLFVNQKGIVSLGKAGSLLQDLTGHSAVAVADGIVYIFGGRVHGGLHASSSSHATNSLMVLALSRAARDTFHQQLTGMGLQSFYGTSSGSWSGGNCTSLTTAGSAPAARHRHKAAFYPQTQKMYIIGGVGDQQQAVDPPGTLHILDVPTSTWSTHHPRGQAPRSALPEAVYLHQGSLYVLEQARQQQGAGSSTTTWALHKLDLSDLHITSDTATKAPGISSTANTSSSRGASSSSSSSSRWLLVQCTGEQPSPRSGCCASLYQGGLYVHGGVRRHRGVQRDMWRLDMGTSHWAEVAHDTLQLPALADHVAVVQGSRVLLVGGYQQAHCGQQPHVFVLIRAVRAAAALPPDSTAAALQLCRLQLSRWLRAADPRQVLLRAADGTEVKVAAAVPPLYSAVLRDMLQAFAGDSDDEHEGEEGSCAVQLANGQPGVAAGQPLVVPLPGAGQESLGNLARWMLGLLGVHALAAGPLVELYRLADYLDMPQLKQQCLAQLASAHVALHHSSLVLQLSRQLRLPELAGLEARALQELRGRLAAEVTGDSLCQVMEVARAVGLPDIEAACRSAAREKLTGRELVGRLRFCLQYGLQECGGVVQLLQEGQWLRSTYGEVLRLLREHKATALEAHVVSLICAHVRDYDVAGLLARAQELGLLQRIGSSVAACYSGDEKLLLVLLRDGRLRAKHQAVLDEARRLFLARQAGGGQESGGGKENGGVGGSEGVAKKPRLGV